MTNGGVQLSTGHDYYLQPKAALVLEAVAHPVANPAASRAAPATGGGVQG